MEGNSLVSLPLGKGEKGGRVAAAAAGSPIEKNPDERSPAGGKRGEGGEGGCVRGRLSLGEEKREGERKKKLMLEKCVFV